MTTTKTILRGALLLTACAAMAAPFAFSFVASVDDTNGIGFYTVYSLPTNAPSLDSKSIIGSTMAGVTNCVLDTTNVATPCFLFATFSNTNGESCLSTPVYFAPVKPKPHPPINPKVK